MQNALGAHLEVVDELAEQGASQSDQIRPRGVPEEAKKPEPEEDDSSYYGTP